MYLEFITTICAVMLLKGHKLYTCPKLVSLLLLRSKRLSAVALSRDDVRVCVCARVFVDLCICEVARLLNSFK